MILSDDARAAEVSAARGKPDAVNAGRIFRASVLDDELGKVFSLLPGKMKFECLATIPENLLREQRYRHKRYARLFPFNTKADLAFKLSETYTHARHLQQQIVANSVIHTHIQNIEQQNPPPHQSIISDIADRWRRIADLTDASTLERRVSVQRLMLRMSMSDISEEMVSAKDQSKKLPVGFSIRAYHQQRHTLDDIHAEETRIRQLEQEYLEQFRRIMTRNPQFDERIALSWMILQSFTFRESWKKLFALLA